MARGSLPPGADDLALQSFDDPTVFGGPGGVTLQHAVALGSGFVVLGSVWHAVDRTTGRAWLSPDGRTWQRVDVPAMDNAFAINDLAAGASSTLVAVGIGDAARGATAWTSFDDGRTWQSTRIGDAPASMQPWRVVAGPRGFLVVASIGNAPARDGDTTLWWSPDARRWTRVEMPSQVFGDVSIYALCATASGFVAVGGRWPHVNVPLADALDRVHGAAWRSVDGLTWVEAAVPEAPALRAIIGTEGAMLAAASGSGGMETTWLRSDDGHTWQPVQGWRDVRNPAGSPEFFGWRGSFYELGADWSSGGPVLELWASPDGNAWQRIGASVEIPMGEIGGGVVPGERGLLVRGARHAAGIVWLIPWPTA